MPRGVIVPLVVEWILSRWGFRTALRAWIVIMVLLTTPAVMFLKPRLPEQHAHTGPQKVELGFLRSPAFWSAPDGQYHRQPRLLHAQPLHAV